MNDDPEQDEDTPADEALDQVDEETPEIKGYSTPPDPDAQDS